MKDVFKYYIGLYGEPAGIVIVLVTCLWDIFLRGARGFLEYSVCWKGIVAILCGVVLIVLSKHFQRTFK